MPSTAYAATSKTVANQAFTSTTSVIQKKATKVTKGDFVLTVNKGQGYIKFKAPKKGKYKFTFSGLKGLTDAGVYNGFVEVLTRDSYDASYSFLTDVKTKGGLSNTLWLRSKIATPPYGEGVDARLLKRSGTIKLQKDQWIYFYLYTSSKSKVNLSVTAI